MAFGKVVADGVDVGLRHVAGDGPHLGPRGTQSLPKGRQGLGAFAVPHEHNRAAAKVEDQGKVAMAFADGQLVDGDLLEVLELRLGAAPPMSPTLPAPVAPMSEPLPTPLPANPRPSQNCPSRD
jgi:hypothetical protein